MYKDFFKLHSAPFKITPDTECFFSEGNRKAILDALIYTVCNGDGITTVIGEVGSGKTLLSRLLAKSLPDQCEILYILNPNIAVDKILYAIALELGLSVDYTQDKVGLLHDVHNKLLELHQNNRQTILLIDEAQAIPLETLEEIRMLSNLETSQNKLLQIVLFGQPELDQKLKQHEVRQIRERIIHSFKLPRFNNTEVNRYLYFRLQKAGFQGVFPFTSLAVLLITLKSSGFLRRVNVLADKCMLAAYSKQSKQVNAKTVLQVIFENSSISKPIWVLGSLVLAIIALVYFQPLNFETHKSQFKKRQITSAESVKKIAIAAVAEPAIKTIEESEISKNTPPLSVSTNPPSSKGYAIQLLSVILEKNQDLKTTVKKHIPQSLWGQDFFYIKFAHIHQIYLGNFSSFQLAKTTLDQLPASLKKNQPFILKRNKNPSKYTHLPLNTSF